MRKTASFFVIACMMTISTFLFTGTTFATPMETNIPKFIEVGKSYYLQANPFTGQVYRIEEIDNIGWIKVYPEDEGKPSFWINVNNIQLMRPIDNNTKKK